jgi:hypothetical protein
LVERRLAVRAVAKGESLHFRRGYNFGEGQVGIQEVQDDIWLVSFMDYDLGYFDLETRVLEPLENPFGPKVLPM